MATVYAIGTASGGVGTSSTVLTTTFTLESAATALAATLNNGNSPCYLEAGVALVAGANTITPPTKAGGVLIIPPAGNTIAITLKGVTGDTGIVLAKIAPTLLTFDTTPPANFCLTVGVGGITGMKYLWL